MAEIFGAALVAATLLAGCGGDGEDVSETENPAPPPPPAPPPTWETPIAVPGTFEAEHFDRGGEGVGYHDNNVGNAGGQYRPSEDVDIVASADSAGGGYVVTGFETNEWLAYTIEVAATGRYDIELRVSSGTAGGTFHVEIDGADVSGRVSVPNTGGPGAFQWIRRERVSLTAGGHVMKIVSDQQYFDLNTVRVTPTPVSTPYFGSAALVPGTLEAEDFDNGGEGVAYHDTDSGNAGGQYRAAEDVDIFASNDPSGGAYIVKNFAADEWLVYTINVAASGAYDLELRAATSSEFPDSAYRLEVDGVDATGVVVLPDTGGWSSYQWIGRKNLSLSAGQHVLKLVVQQPYFALNAVRIALPVPPPPPPPPPPPSAAQFLFSSGFESTSVLGAPTDFWSTGAWQDITGTDTGTGFAWPPSIWGGGYARFQLLTTPMPVTAVTIGAYMFNRIESVAGHDGTTTKALYQQITQNLNGVAPMERAVFQNSFHLRPVGETSDLYVSYWLKFQPDLVQQMTNLPAVPGTVNGGTWRAFFSFKTGTQGDDGDYRVEVYVRTDNNAAPYWAILGDNNAGGGAPLVNSWSLTNNSVPVPIGQWFKFEIFWHRSAGSDGRVWVGVNGQNIFDRYGANMGAWNLPINRIIAPLLYSGSFMPIYQWVDDLEIWDDFPPVGSNPPYAPH